MQLYGAKADKYHQQLTGRQNSCLEKQARLKAGRNDGQ
jgi:hypothetical protein